MTKGELVAILDCVDDHTQVFIETEDRQVSNIMVKAEVIGVIIADKGDD